MASEQCGLFGILNPEGVLVRVLPDGNAERFQDAVAVFVSNDAEALVQDRPQIDDNALKGWIRTRLAGYKLARLG